MDRKDCLDEMSGEAVGLLTTYRCNLNCRYCYVRTKRDKDMSFDMVKSIIERFLMRTGGRLDIAFMGGETLLAIDVIRPLVEWVERGSWNRPYKFFGSTNGTISSFVSREIFNNKSIIL
ncbi:MAG: radical SAM protein [Alistipes sp.]|nr:radical SAM protein [Alistipes sp.]